MSGDFLINELAADNLSPPRVSGGVVVGATVCKDDWIVSVFLRVADDNTTGQSISLINNLLYDRNGLPVNFHFPLR